MNHTVLGTFNTHSTKKEELSPSQKREINALIGQFRLQGINPFSAIGAIGKIVPKEIKRLKLFKSKRRRMRPWLALKSKIKRLCYQTQYQTGLKASFNQSDCVRRKRNSTHDLYISRMQKLAWSGNQFARRTMGFMYGRRYKRNSLF